ncbi:MAG: peptide ABC transporter substrate-binding protein [Gammaproteobacteria bacterium]|nr:MAG: peptide ABC transporter substrate-binding protein [Gammaproteobacteria bacterium]
MSTSNDRILIESIAEAARRGKVSRREFMQFSVAAGITATAGSALWTSEVSAQTPKKGGTFRVGVHNGNTSDSMDPGAYQAIGEIQLAHTFRSYLTEITSENGLGPDMADAWETNDDATVWTFQLNPDATFHDGRSFTARDAVASLNHHRGDDTSSAAKALLETVSDVKADGDHTLIVELSTGVADFPWLMTDYHLAMLPAKEDGTVEWKNWTGAGPYKIVSHKPGVTTSMVRHDGWHREGAYFDAVEFTYINDPNARQTALMTGDVDSITSPDLKTLSLLQRNKDIAIDNTPSGSALTFPMFADVDPYTDVHVRLAMKHAINRQELIDKTMFGTGTVANDVHVSSNMPYYAELEQTPYDPDKAKFHLGKAGLDKLKVDLSTSDSVYPSAVDMCTLFAEHARPAGITINVVREPADGYWSNVWLKKPFCFVKWGARPTPDNIFSLAYASDVVWNESHWSNARFDELLEQARAELDDDLRTEMYAEMQQLAKDDGSTVIPAFVNFVCARNAKVMHGPSVAASWENDGARAAHRWWFA